VGTGGWHWWAQVGGAGGHRWVALLGTGRWHCRVAQVGALLGTGGGTAGNGWAGLVVRTADRNLRGSLLGTDHQGTDHQCPDDRCRSPRSDNCRFSAVLSSRSDSVRKVQPRTGTC
ncbi:unnamed protein product, partial [Staurois parvus]